MMEITDQQILQLFSEEKNKEYAFKLLMEKYRQDIYFSIRRLVYLHDDTDDIIQNVLIKIWRHLNKFRGESSLKTWISRICINESLTFIEKKKKLLQLNDSEYADFMVVTLAEDRYFSADKIESLLQHAIMKLPPKQRTVFLLRYYDEMPYEQISKILDTSVGALKASYHVAAKKIEDFLSNS